MVDNGPGVDKTELRQTNTQELISGPKLAKSELEDIVRHRERANFDLSGLNVTEGEDMDVMPGHNDVQLERAKIKLIGGVQNFNPEYLSRSIEKEPKGGTKPVRRERGHQALQRGVTGDEGLHTKGLPKVCTL